MNGYTAFSSERFRDLEEYHKIYQQSKVRTPSGQWKLLFFYHGIFNSDLVENGRFTDDQRKWDGVEKKLLKWINSYAESPAPYIAYAEFLNTRAWYLRGGSFARDVPREKFRSFDEEIQKQRSVLEVSKTISSVDPHWYVSMLEVAQAQAWDRKDVKSLLYEALSKELYYRETYRITFSYLLPKWYGSFEEAEQFAVDASALTQKCEGKSIYARIYWRILYTESEFTVIPFNLQKGSWRRMSEGFDDLVKHYPNSWNINSYAKFACLAGDREKTKELLNSIGNKPNQAVWKESEIDFSDCQNLAK